MSLQTIQQVLQDHRDFVDRELLVQGFLEAYVQDPIFMLDVYVSKAVIKRYKLKTENPEYLWEGLEDIAYDLSIGHTLLSPKKHLGFKQVGGVYNQLDFVPEKDKTTVLETTEWVANEVKHTHPMLKELNKKAQEKELAKRSAKKSKKGKKQK
jgi:hypothetical protein